MNILGDTYLGFAGPSEGAQQDCFVVSTCLRPRATVPPASDGGPGEFQVFVDFATVVWSAVDIGAVVHPIKQ